MFFGTLHLLRELIRLPARRVQKGMNKVWTRLPILPMVGFLGAVVTSLLMPLWIDGRLWIQSSDLMDPSRAPLHFGLKHITATLYIIYGLLFTLVVANKCSNPFVLRHYLRLYCWSGLFVCTWGGVQLLLYHLDLPYPALIFNSSVSNGANLYSSEITELGLKRMSSVAVESSILSQYLLTVLPFLLFRVVARQPLISGRWDKVISGSLLVALLLTTLTTAYIGLLLLLPVFVYCTHRLHLVRTSDLAFGTLAGCTVAAFVVANASVTQLFATEVVGKLGTYSGLERAHSVATAVMYFYQYPLLGVGWGSVASHDLIVKLLANTGIVGLCTFVILVATCLLRLRQHIRRQLLCGPNYSEAMDALACLVAFSLLILLNAVTGFAYVFGHFWFVLAVSLGAPLQRCLRYGRTLDL